MKNNVRGSLLILISMAIGVMGCQHNTLQDLTDPTSTINCDPDTVYLQNDIYPLIISNCANANGCHNGVGGGEEEAKDLTTYAKIINSDYVEAFHANSSEMIEAVTGGGEEFMPPSPNTPLTAAQISLLKTWINQGARNNGCEGGDCDTTAFTYSGTISGIINTYCIGCHQGASPSGDLTLSTYSDVSAIAANGSLLGSIEFQAGYVAMPYGASMLPDCKITQIRKWIENGYPND